MVRRITTLCLSLCLFPLFANAAAPLEGHTIVVDPGHATLNYWGRLINPGKKTNNGIIEHELNMAISNELATLLEKEGARVVFTRTDEDYFRESYTAAEDNKARALFANELKADIYLSIHCDWHPNRNVHGVTTFYKKAHSEPLGRAIQRSMVRTLRARDRHLVREDFTVLDNTDMPSLIIESGFMSHRGESKKLLDSSYQKKVALAITKGVVSYFSNQ